MSQIELYLINAIILVVGLVGMHYLGYQRGYHKGVAIADQTIKTFREVLITQNKELQELKNPACELCGSYGKHAHCTKCEEQVLGEEDGLCQECAR